MFKSKSLIKKVKESAQLKRLIEAPLFFEIIVFLFFVILSGVMTFPLIAQMGNHIGQVDPTLNAWIINWNHHIFENWDLKNYFNDPRFYPYVETLLTGDHLFLLSLLTYPFYVLFKNPILNYNILLFLSFPLSCYAAYRLGRFYLKERHASILVGIAWGFAAFRFGNLSHLQILSSYFLPISILFFEKLLSSARADSLGSDEKNWWRELILVSSAFGVTFAFAGLMTIYQLAFGAVILGLIGLYRLIISRYEFNWKKLSIGFAVAVTLSVLIMGPFYFKYYKFSKEQNAERSIKTSQLYNADLTSIFHAAPDNLFYGQSCPFLNKFSTKASPCHETSMFQGLTILILGLVALIKLVKRKGYFLFAIRNDKKGLYFAFMILCSYLFALGPKLKILGNETPLTLPFTFLYKVFIPMHGTRVPGRFSMFYSLFLALLGGKGLCLILRSQKNNLTKYLIGLFISCLVLIESYSGPISFPEAMESENLEVYRFLKADNNIEVVVELPIGVPAVDNNVHNIRSLVPTIYHGKQTINGYGGFFPNGYNNLSYYLTREFPSEESIEVLQGLGVDAIVIRLSYFDEKSMISYEGMEEVEKIFTDEQFQIYSIDKEGFSGISDTDLIQYKVSDIILEDDDKVLKINGGFYNNSNKIWATKEVLPNQNIDIFVNGKKIRRKVISHPLFLGANSSKSARFLVDRKILGLKRRRFESGDVIEVYCNGNKVYKFLVD